MNKHTFLITILIISIFISINSYAQSDIPNVDISNYPQEAKEGNKVFYQKCVKCHSAARPLNAPYTGEAWKTTIYRMMRKEGSFLTKKEADKVYAFLAHYSSTKKPAQAVETKGLSPIDAGKKVYQQKGCAACHIISGIGGKVGPDLTAIGKTRDSKFLYRWLKNPQAVKPATTMPNLNLNERELKPLVEFLTSLK